MFEDGVVPGKVYADADWKSQEDLAELEKEQMETSEKRCSICQSEEDLLWCKECGKFFCINCRQIKTFDGLFSGWTERCPQGHKLRVRGWKIG